MSSLPNASPSLDVPDDTAAAVLRSRNGYLECHRCHRQCKSQTWLLKHLEACSKAESTPTTRGHSASGYGSAGSSHAALLAPAKAMHAGSRRLSRTSATEDAAPPLLESAGTSTSSSNASYPHVYIRNPSRLTQSANGRRGRDGSLSDSTSPGAGDHLRAATFSGVASRGVRGESGRVVLTATSQPSPNGLIDDVSASAFAAANGRSRPASPSQCSSSHVGGPWWPRIGGSGGDGSGSPRGLAASGRASAPSGTPVSSFVSAGHDGAEVPQRPQQQPQRRRLGRQGSFRLKSENTWTQFTPSTSEEEDSDDNGGGDVHDERDGSLLGRFSGHSSRECGGVRVNGHPPARGHDGSPDAWLHERQLSEGSHRNGAGTPHTAGDVSRRSATRGPHGTSLPREAERQVPQLFSGSIGDLSPMEQHAGGVGDGWPTAGSGANSGRLHRSARDSLSQGSLSRMSSSASPMFAQGIGSPSLLPINISPTNPAVTFVSQSRLGGLNASVSGGGGGGGARTPRHGDRSGAATPRAISFQRGRAVGSGGFGTVYQAILSDGSLAAVKELKLENTNLKAIDREVRAMSSIPLHPNCVRYLGSRYSAHHYYIIMEYISGGSINSLRKSVGRFRESVFQRYAYMVLLGLSHLHANGIVHRDIKGANVLLDESGCAKIVDFGCSRDLNQATTTQSGGGTPLWMAPEVCRGEPTTVKSDVWAFGCLCLEMTNETGVPWNFPPGMTLQGVVYALACAKSSPPIPSDLSPEAQDFLQRCLLVDPVERATVAELLQHPFFDVDLMEDSEEDELLSSSGASARQSAVKRAVRHMNRSSALDAATHHRRRHDESDNGEEEEEEDEEFGGGGGGGGGGTRCNRGMRSFIGAPISPRDVRDSGGGGPRMREADLATMSHSTHSHSKSPSGPQLDHYTRSVNVGFSLSAVEEEDEEEDGGGGGGDSRGPVAAMCAPAAASPGPCVVEGAPPAISETAVPANRRRVTEVVVESVEEDEDEYTQMITEMITEAREAYTDEERRMTERRRLRNEAYLSSDDDDTTATATANTGSNASKNAHEVGSDGGSSGEAAEGSHPRDAESDMSALSGSDADDGGNEGSPGGPRHHSLGETWRTRSARASAASKSPEPPHNVSGRVPHLPNGSEAAAPAASIAREAVLGPAARAGASPPARSPAQPHIDPTNMSISMYTPSASTASVLVAGVAPPSPRHRSPHSVYLDSSSAVTHSPQPQLQPQPPVGLAHSGAVVSTSPSDARLGYSPHESGGPAGPRPPLGSAGPFAVSDQRSSNARIPPPPPLESAASSSMNPASSHAEFAGSPIEWYTGGSGRLEPGGGGVGSGATWKTAASGRLSKELSMAQKEMQEMLDWGSDCRHTLLSPDTDRRGSKTSSSSVANPSAGRGSDGHAPHRHNRLLHWSRSSHDEDLDSSGRASLAEQLSRRESAALFSTETVAAATPASKRRHSGLSIFRSRKSK